MGTICAPLLGDLFPYSFESESRGGGRGHSYIIKDMDVRQGLSSPLPFADQNFDKWRKIFENIYPKTPENEFLCIIGKIS